MDKFNELMIELKLLKLELKLHPNRKDYLEYKIKDIENKLAALDKADFFDEL